MLKKFRLNVVILGFVVLFFATGLYAAPKDLTERFLSKAEEALGKQDIDKAYNYVNTAFVMFYDTAEENENTLTDDLGKPSENISNTEKEVLNRLVPVAQAVYSRKVQQLIQHALNKTKSYDVIELDLAEIRMNLNNYPIIKTSDIVNSITKITNIIEGADIISQEAPTEQNFNEFEKKLQALEDAQNTLAESQDDFKVLENTVVKNIEETKRSTNVIAFAIISVSAIILVIILLIVVICKKGFSQQQIQQEQYIQAFKMMAASRNNQHKNYNVLGGVTDIYGSNAPLKFAGSSVLSSKAIPSITFSDNDEKELKKLAIKCEELGCRIDAVTNRKNNSKNVSEIVYKLSLQLGLTPNLAMVNFCAAMVYDVGFLGVDPDLLSSSFMTKEEKESLKIHVSLAKNYLNFVPDKYWSIFEDAVMKHHENMDGSGYPNGLKGDEIPLIARLIHISESYISISSRRVYRAPTDKETAVSKLKNEPQLYDETIVDALDKIV